MLVLSRKEGESIVIDDIIKITVTGIAGGRVKIGIEAPQDVHIVRGELLDKKSDSSLDDSLNTKSVVS